MKDHVDEDALTTIFTEYCQCGTCRKKEKKIVLQCDEVDSATKEFPCLG